MAMNAETEKDSKNGVARLKHAPRIMRQLYKSAAVASTDLLFSAEQWLPGPQGRALTDFTFTVQYSREHGALASWPLATVATLASVHSTYVVP